MLFIFNKREHTLIYIYVSLNIYPCIHSRYDVWTIPRSATTMVGAIQWGSLGGGCLNVSIEYLSWQTFYYNMDIVAASIEDESIAGVCSNLLFDRNPYGSLGNQMVSPCYGTFGALPDLSVWCNLCRKYYNDEVLCLGECGDVWQDHSAGEMTCCKRRTWTAVHPLLEQNGSSCGE